MCSFVLFFFPSWVFNTPHNSYTPRLEGKFQLFPRPRPPSLGNNTLTFYLLYHMRVILVLRIFLCSWKMPYMRASLVGGQPGT